MKEYIVWHDKETKQLIENFEVNWKMDERLTYADGGAVPTTRWRSTWTRPST